MILFLTLYVFIFSQFFQVSLGYFYNLIEKKTGFKTENKNQNITLVNKEMLFFILKVDPCASQIDVTTFLGLNLRKLGPFIFSQTCKT